HWLGEGGGHGRARLRARASAGPQGPRGGAPFPPGPHAHSGDVVDGGGAGRDRDGGSRGRPLRALSSAQGQPLAERGDGAARRAARAPRERRRRRAPHSYRSGKALEELVRRGDRGRLGRRPVRGAGWRVDAAVRSRVLITSLRSSSLSFSRYAVWR